MEENAFGFIWIDKAVRIKFLDALQFYLYFIQTELYYSIISHYLSWDYNLHPYRHKSDPPIQSSIFQLTLT